MSALLGLVLYGLYISRLPSSEEVSNIKATSTSREKVVITDPATNCDEDNQEYIAFLVSQDLYIISSEACNPQLLMKDVSDSPVWSPDAKWIVVGCQNDSKLCFIDVTKAVHNTATTEPTSRKASKILSLPKTCSGNSIQSLSWSPDGAFIVIVCVAEGSASEIYIVNLEQQTFQGVFTDKEILRALWSPTDPKILISTLKGEIYAIDLQGKNRTFLVTGWSPEWSSDGQKIVFIKPNDSDAIHQKGIAVLNLGSLTVEWLYLPSAVSEQPDLILGCGDLRFDCRLALSADGRYLAVGARFGTMFNWDIFRLDLVTGELINLTKDLNTAQNYEPDWEP